MSAEDVAIITIAFPDPTFSSSNNLFQQVDPHFSFQDPISGNIRTLSTSDAADGVDITGLLYVPDLLSEDCRNASKPYVPANATGRAALPHNDYSLVAFAPWFSPECTLEYLNSTQNTPTHAFLFYQPQTNSTDIPPLANDPSWSLGDGGVWKKNNPFPVYALPGFHGNLVMTQLNLYSKNVTEVPYGHYLVQSYPASDYIRLWTQISTSDESKLPSLWVFLLITLGLLVLIIGGTSFSMHMLQRRRRRDLQRRIMNGEVDLEALGIKRLTVPQDILEKMPLHIYTPDPVPLSTPATTHPPDGISNSRVTSSAQASTANQTLSDRNPAFSQSTCPICLDDFVANETTVRELPCRHIFHPDCVDTFLLNNSSLCPMCKNSTLPKGYCPSLITNAMVRRERLVRRARQRRGGGLSGRGGRMPVLGAMSQGGPPTERHRLFREALAETILGRRFGRGPAANVSGRATQPGGSASPSNRDSTLSARGALQQPANTDIELGVASASAPAEESAPQEQQPQQQPTPQPAAAASTPPQASSVEASSSRREWARERALALLGSRRHVVDADEEAQSRPLWRRAFGKIFPGLA